MSQFLSRVYYAKCLNIGGMVYSLSHMLKYFILRSSERKERVMYLKENSLLFLPRWCKHFSLTSVILPHHLIFPFEQI